MRLMSAYIEGGAELLMEARMPQEAFWATPCEATYAWQCSYWRLHDS